MTREKMRDFCWNLSSKDKNKYPPLDKLFQKMWNIYDEYIRLLQDDLPFWDTEWSLVGHMTVAASEFGPTALEYNARRTKKGRTRRPDAWFRFTGEGRDTLIEAKKDGLSLITSEEKITEYALDYLKGCGNYLRRFSSINSSWTASVFFLQLYARNTGDQVRYQSQVNEFLKKCKLAYTRIAKTCNHPFWAYYFLKHDQFKDHQLLKGEDGYYYPGVVIFGDLRKVE